MEAETGVVDRRPGFFHQGLGAVWRKIAAPIEAPILKATRGRVRLSLGIPVVVLTSIGARSSKRWETPLAYFTDGDYVILIASNWGRERHPAWYHNLLAHPECELHIGPRGGAFMARKLRVPTVIGCSHSPWIALTWLGSIRAANQWDQDDPNHAAVARAAVPIRC